MGLLSPRPTFELGPGPGHERERVQRQAALRPIGRAATRPGAAGGVPAVESRGLSRRAALLRGTRRPLRYFRPADRSRERAAGERMALCRRARARAPDGARLLP